MYFLPKNDQNGQNKNFPRHNTAIWWFKAIVPSFWPSFRQIWRAVTKKMSENLIFEQNGQILDQKGSKNGPDFFVRTKIFIDHF